MESVQKIEREIPTYISLNAQDYSAKYLVAPKIDEVPYPVVMDINLVVEFYSK